MRNYGTVGYRKHGCSLPVEVQDAAYTSLTISPVFSRLSLSEHAYCLFFLTISQTISQLPTPPHTHIPTTPIRPAASLNVVICVAAVVAVDQQGHCGGTVCSMSISSRLSGSLRTPSTPCLITLSENRSYGCKKIWPLLGHNVYWRSTRTDPSEV